MSEFVGKRFQVGNHPEWWMTSAAAFSSSITEEQIKAILEAVCNVEAKLPEGEQVQPALMRKKVRDW